MYESGQEKLGDRRMGVYLASVVFVKEKCHGLQKVTDGFYGVLYGWVNTIEAIGKLLAHACSYLCSESRPFSSRATSVFALQRLTRSTFFCVLPNDLLCSKAECVTSQDSVARSFQGCQNCV